MRKVWDEFFGRKPYRAHSMGIASESLISIPLLTLLLKSKALEPQLQCNELHPIKVLRHGDAVKHCCHEVLAKVLYSSNSIATYADVAALLRRRWSRAAAVAYPARGAAQPGAAPS